MELRVALPDQESKRCKSSTRLSSATIKGRLELMCREQHVRRMGKEARTSDGDEL